MNGRVRMARIKMAGLGWTERAVGGLLLVLTVFLLVAVGLLILGVLVAGGLVLAGWLWWGRRRLLSSAMQDPLVVEGAYRELDPRHDGTDREEAFRERGNQHRRE